jgi:hypothetical protein
MCGGAPALSRWNGILAIHLDISPMPTICGNMFFTVQACHFSLLPDQSAIIFVVIVVAIYLLEAGVSPEIAFCCSWSVLFSRYNFRS